MTTSTIPSSFQSANTVEGITHATNLKSRKRERKREKFYNRTFDHQRHGRAKNCENIALQTAKDPEVIHVYPLARKKHDLYGISFFSF